MRDGIFQPEIETCEDNKQQKGDYAIKKRE